MLSEQFFKIFSLIAVMLIILEIAIAIALVTL
jgi:hypothetical protein